MQNYNYLVVHYYWCSQKLYNSFATRPEALAQFG